MTEAGPLMPGPEPQGPQGPQGQGLHVNLETTWPRALDISVYIIDINAHIIASKQVTVRLICMCRRTSWCMHDHRNDF